VKIVAIVQARVGSSRLPGKVLLDLEGAPLIDRVINRVRAADRVDEVWVACPDGTRDDPLAAHCQSAGVSVARGSETDVLSRFSLTASMADADVVVRVTADCPLLDPAVIDRVIGVLVDHQPQVDYAANVLVRSYPRGLDTEVFTRSALERMNRLGRTPAAREHVTLGPRLEHRAHFVTRNVAVPGDDSDLRWTVDTAADLSFVRALYRAMRLGDRIGSYQETVDWCRAHPSIARGDDRGLTWEPIPTPDDGGAHG
jgi:spore coat polysaccharide biosynthesis protein SpsF (cytidylyltransferase family)